jgi:hypothetical protein
MRMSAMIPEAKDPFRFFTRQSLTILTGRKATNLSELLEGIRAAKDSSIFHHTHQFLLRHTTPLSEPSNDFAFWISDILQERLLGEEVASLDFRQCDSLGDIRSRIVESIERLSVYSAERAVRSAPPGEEFHFLEVQSFVMPTPQVARNLIEFRDCLARASLNAVYFHVIEARLRQKESEFSFWLSHVLQEQSLAQEFRTCDPYTQTLEGIRRTYVNLIERRLNKERGTNAAGL